MKRVLVFAFFLISIGLTSCGIFISKDDEEAIFDLDKVEKLETGGGSDNGDPNNPPPGGGGGGTGD